MSKNSIPTSPASDMDEVENFVTRLRTQGKKTLVKSRGGDRRLREERRSKELQVPHDRRRTQRRSGTDRRDVMLEFLNSDASKPVVVKQEKKSGLFTSLMEKTGWRVSKKSISK